MGSKSKKVQVSAEEQTPEQKIAALEAKNAQLESDLKKSQKETAAGKPKKLEFEVDEETEEGEATGEVLKYRVVVPLFDIDNVQYKATEVIAGYEAEIKANKPGVNCEVLSKLVQMGSGIVELVD